MKTATLGIVLQDGNVLLGEKKKGEIGTGVLSGPGGKLDLGETFDSDRHWFLKAALGEKFRAQVHYRERAKGFIRIDFLPFAD